MAAAGRFLLLKALFRNRAARVYVRPYETKLPVLGETKRLVLVYIYASRRHNRDLAPLDAVAATYPASASDKSKPCFTRASELSSSLSSVRDSAS